MTPLVTLTPRFTSRNRPLSGGGIPANRGRFRHAFLDKPEGMNLDVLSEDKFPIIGVSPCLTLVWKKPQCEAMLCESPFTNCVLPTEEFSVGGC
jgi:hypothetical protein